MACLLAVFSAAAVAADPYSYLDLDFLQTKPDNATTSSGYSALASFGIEGKAYFMAGYDHVSVNGEGLSCSPFGGCGGIRYQYDYSNMLLEFGGHTNGPRADLIYGLNFQNRSFANTAFLFSLTAPTTNENGIGPTLGLRIHPTEKLDMYVIVRQTNFSSVGGVFEGQFGTAYRLGQQAGVDIRYFGSDKYSGFAIGFRYNF